MKTYMANNTNRDDRLGLSQQYWKFSLGIFIFLASLFIRYRIRVWTNIDTSIIEGWYKFLFEHGAAGLANGTFSNYPPAYLYCLWLTTSLSHWISPLVSIKLIPTLFDLISTFSVYLLARTKYDRASAFLFSGMFFILPTVLINSSGWGQIDR